LLETLLRDRTNLIDKTATAGFPAVVTPINNGGLSSGELESGTTTTVRRRAFTISFVITMHGRVF
jgi:hypothetical protein